MMTTSRQNREAALAAFGRAVDAVREAEAAILSADQEHPNVLYDVMAAALPSPDAMWSGVWDVLEEVGPALEREEEELECEFSTPAERIKSTLAWADKLEAEGDRFSADIFRSHCRLWEEEEVARQSGGEAAVEALRERRIQEEIEQDRRSILGL